MASSELSTQLLTRLSTIPLEAVTTAAGNVPTTHRPQGGGDHKVSQHEIAPHGRQQGTCKRRGAFRQSGSEDATEAGVQHP